MATYGAVHKIRPLSVMNITQKKDNNQPGPCLETIHLPEKEIYICIYQNKQLPLMNR
jgi:hypothetical protein